MFGWDRASLAALDLGDLGLMMQRLDMKPKNVHTEESPFLLL
jgi:hypothetical protein